MATHSYLKKEIKGGWRSLSNMQQHSLALSSPERSTLWKGPAFLYIYNLIHILVVTCELLLKRGKEKRKVKIQI